MTDTEQLLKLSLLYHQFLKDLEDLGQFELTSTQRSRAFQRLSELGEAIEVNVMRKNIKLAIETLGHE